MISSSSLGLWNTTVYNAQMLNRSTSFFAIARREHDAAQTSIPSSTTPLLTAG